MYNCINISVHISVLTWTKFSMNFLYSVISTPFLLSLLYFFVWTSFLFSLHLLTPGTRAQWTTGLLPSTEVLVSLIPSFRVTLLGVSKFPEDKVYSTSRSTSGSSRSKMRNLGHLKLFSLHSLDTCYHSVPTRSKGKTVSLPVCGPSGTPMSL